MNKKRFSFIKLMLFIVITYMMGCFVYNLLRLPINTIFIENNSYLSDQEVIEALELDDYPSFILTLSSTIKKRALDNPMIKNVKITKKLDRTITIYIEENVPLFIYNNKIILEGGETTTNNYILPILTGNLSDDVLNKLINKFSLIDENIKVMISEIKYEPNDLDKERFVFTMNDGNYVYITLYKISAINDYIKILNTLDNKKGILYLDSGNYFEIIGG